jgi:hypothetical protein
MYCVRKDGGKDGPTLPPSLSPRSCGCLRATRVIGATTPASPIGSLASGRAVRLASRSRTMRESGLGRDMPGRVLMCLSSFVVLFLDSAS